MLSLRKMRLVGRTGMVRAWTWRRSTPQQLKKNLFCLDKTFSESACTWLLCPLVPASPRTSSCRGAAAVREMMRAASSSSRVFIVAVCMMIPAVCWLLVTTALNGMQR